jgi:glucose-6-phosphate isomerase
MTDHLFNVDTSLLFKENLENSSNSPGEDDLKKISRELASTFQKLSELSSTGEAEFFNLPDRADRLTSVEHLHKTLAVRKFKDFVLIGIGGSSLGAKMLINCIGNKNQINFHYLDNSDPELAEDIFSKVDLTSTLFYVVSKSGSTMETIAGLLALIQKFDENGIEQSKWKQNIVVATDPKSGDLRSFAESNDIPILEIPTKVGGRFSVLTPVGFFPALFAGIDAKEILKGASDARRMSMTTTIDSNPILKSCGALLLHLNDFNRNETVLMPYSNRLNSFIDWFIQLWAESLGKNGKGLTPIGALGATDQHSKLQLFMDGPDNKVINFISCEKPKSETQLSQRDFNLASFELLRAGSMEKLIKTQFLATRNALRKTARPSFTISLGEINEYSIGQLIFYYETLTVLIGFALNINPFDQPGVELSKILTKEGLK